ncbi:amidohydrolase family protein [Pseudidiomarina halophila]|uniref:Amidohydrolase-related domain-containing protein n=1 Tax=Pseudidiomarina halophila TaxID=1449799 RepID=A0A432XVF2_9GAMM|nr:amidohydrolase family protein [Pseudidiomarina halophila]RUO52718.1 hypothetical protein CWI69_06670 [Pseudidiomarina halophila]
MTVKYALFTLLLSAFSVSVHSAEVYRNGKWWDGSDFVATTFYVEDGVFVDPGAVEKVSISHDLQGAFVLPPLADAHNHNLQSPWLADNFHDRYLKQGILYGAMLCGSHSSAKLTRERLKLAGLPSIKVAGACLSSSDGHPLRMALKSREGQPDVAPDRIYDKSYLVIDTVADINKKWPLIEQGAVDLVKIIIVHHEDQTRRDNEEFFGVNGLSAEVVVALVPFLQERGLRVVAHTESAADFALAVAAGVDWIGHLPGYHWSTGKTAAAYRLTEEVAAQAAAKGIHVIPTAGVVNLFSDLSPAQRQQVQALQRENLRRLRQAGVSFLTGSDQFMGSVVDELIYLREILGFDAQALINSATRTTPQALFPGRKVGKLEIGFEASFNVYQTNPVTDFSNLSAPAQVVQQGAEVIIQPEQPN